MTHKVIRNLIEQTLEAAQEERISFECIQKVGRKSAEEHPAIKEEVSPVFRAARPKRVACWPKRESALRAAT